MATVDPSYNPPSHIYDAGSPGDNSNIAFSLFGLQVAWYGIFIFIGFFVAIILICLKLKFIYKVSIDPFYYFCVIGIPSAILFARIGSCIINDAQWSDFWDLRGGGLAIEWGVIGVLILALIYFPLVLRSPKYHVRDTLPDGNIAIKKISIFVYLDAIAPAVLIAQSIGRWGNYFNQELYGSPVTSKWLIDFMHDYLPRMYIDGQWMVPLFFYESLINIAGFIIIFILLELIRNKSFRKCGDLAFIYFLWYGTVRLCLEPLRDQQYTFPITYYMTGIWIGLSLVLLICNHLLYKVVRKYNFSLIVKVFFTKILNSKIKGYRMSLKLNNLTNQVKRIEKNKDKSEKVHNELKDLRKERLELLEDIKVNNNFSSDYVKKIFLISQRKDFEYFYYNNL